ncbi:MAG: hypothetical protein KIT09_04100 [Bryobacteraceae bacterium]|nr:hypothetical protein [Bryobacteraceae bacterium]
MNGCGFSITVPFDLIPPETTPIATPTEQAESIVYEDPGTIVVYHGHACAESDQPGAEVRLRVRHELKLPQYVGSATVILNGWQVKYLHDDHHVADFATVIYGISFERNILRWNASGRLSDKNFDDAYGWCYRYTAIGWNPTALQAVVDHADEDHVMRPVAQDNTTALKEMKGFLPVSALPARSPIAVLPRGYMTAYLGDADHHLLQLAYNLDYSEKFVEHEKKYSRISGTACCNSADPALPAAANYAEGFVSWDSKTIFKDNGLRRDYHNSELVSALGGPDVGVIQPPFTVLPREDADSTTGCIIGGAVLSTREVTTEEIPFEYAIPMLTGWELAYACDDAHIRVMGAWIERFSYARPSGGAGGKLQYSVSTMFHDNQSGEHISSARAHVLGFKRIAAAPTPAPIPGPVKP